MAGNGANPSVLRSCARHLPLAGEDETLAAAFESWRDAFGEGAEIVEPASRVRLAHCDEIDRVLFGDVFRRKDVRAGRYARMPNADTARDAHRSVHTIPVAPLFCRFDTDGRPFFEFEHGADMGRAARMSGAQAIYF